MVKSVKKVAGMDVELTVEGRNLLSVASWRIISNKEENKGGEGKLKTELQLICYDILGVLGKHLIPAPNIGDYHGYLAEFATRNDRKEAVENSLMAYKAASAIAMIELGSAHPIHLGLALSFSIHTCRLTKAAFNDAVAELATLSEESSQDTTPITQLLGDGEEQNKEALQDVEDDNQ
ncbi:hypothetical protein FD755_018927 [Muntiacus reevesi]|uniref:14-3-3 domain-containing protein n=1 Tax=Muntiacus reevesi TaxID=9886 RepID=A0A5N3X4W7_MUNRE|nr:hypothetical protein FD755_018927 [Muntiacus reevesi]